MAITRLTGLMGQAEVLGEWREVLWSEEGGLVLKGMTLEDAQRALDLLASGTVIGVKLPVQRARPRDEGASAKPAQPDKFPSHLPTVADLPSAMVPLASKEQVKEAVAKPAEKCSEPQCECHDAPAPAKANGKVDATPLQGMTSLGEIVVHLYEKGTTTPDVLVAECVALKEQVPLLGRITNLEERVRRAYEVKGLGRQA